MSVYDLKSLPFLKYHRPVILLRMANLLRRIIRGEITCLSGKYGD